jgi:excisionase family DNA binding protein
MKAVHLHCEIVLDRDGLTTLAEVIQQAIEKGVAQHTQAVVKAFGERAPGPRPDAALVERPSPPPPPIKPESSPEMVGLIDGKEVAKLLNVSFRTVYRLKDSGRMPQPVRLGNAVRWSREAIKSWIEAGCPREDRQRRKTR